MFICFLRKCNNRRHFIKVHAVGNHLYNLRTPVLPYWALILKSKSHQKQTTVPIKPPFTPPKNHVHRLFTTFPLNSYPSIDDFLPIPRVTTFLKTRHVIKFLIFVWTIAIRRKTRTWVKFWNTTVSCKYRAGPQSNGRALIISPL